MDDQHYDALQELAACRFLPGSFDKRFSRQLASLPHEAELTPKQIRCLKRLYYKYRNQIRTRNPDADFIWTFDADQPEPGGPAPDGGYKIVCGPPRSGRLSQEEADQLNALHQRYGKIPGNIADFWSK